MLLNLGKRAQTRYNESYSTVQTSAVSSPQCLCSYSKLRGKASFNKFGCEESKQEGSFAVPLFGLSSNSFMRHWAVSLY